MDKKFKLESVILVEFLQTISDQEAVFPTSWGHHFRSTFIASRYNYMIYNECIKGEEVE